jgi:hypothetical protein
MEVSPLACSPCTFSGCLLTTVYVIHPSGWILGAPVIAPAIASNVMVTPGRAFPHAPPQWAGMAILIAYALVLTAAGVVRTRRHDVA